MNTTSRFVTQILFVIAFVFGGSTNVSAEIIKGSCGENATWVLDTEIGLLEINGTGEMEDFIANGSNSPWFCNTEIKEVVFSEGITSICEAAFDYCTGITEVHLPKTLTTIGRVAFACCESLASIDIPSKVETIGEAAFFYCHSLSSVTIGENVKFIGGGAFGHCSGLKEITISSSVTSIGDGAFRDCNNLESIRVDSSNTNYDSRNNCNAIIETSSNKLIQGCKNTKIPDDITSIGYHAFGACSGLSSVVIPNSVKEIENMAFAYCQELQTVIIGDGVTRIGDGAFCDCTALTHVTMGANVAIIEGGVFAQCEALTEITIGPKVERLGQGVFDNSNNLKSVYNLRDKPQSWNGNIPQGCTVFVNRGCASAYKKSSAWNIYNIQELNTCIAPTIAYSNGKITCKSETENSICHYEYSIKGYGADEGLPKGSIIEITAYASADGLSNSEKVTETFDYVPIIKGDMDNDGKVTIRDANIIVNMYLGKGY